ncbi:hypothetical protein [Phyllobacterium sp. SB3]|uniref:hypothetical protein n=1 Tax=Phyllobacterium sp. SB3 TaxID=3156073 RepID=UPI0032B00D01
MYDRFAEHRVEEALSDTPVVLIVEPRRASKTTLVRKMLQRIRSHGHTMAKMDIRTSRATIINRFQ